MAIAAKIAVDIVARTESFQKAMTGLSDRLKSTGKSLQDTGQALSSAFTIPLAAASVGIYQAVQAAGDLGEAQSAIGVIFEDSADKINAFSQTAATSLGMSRMEALDAAKTFGVFASAAGLSGDEMVKFSTDAVQLATDLASIYNANPQDTILALGAALRGEAEPIRNFGILLDDATLRQRALSMGIVDSIKTALTPQQRVLAANAEVFAQTGKQQGDFQRTVNSLANQQRILTAQFKDAAAALGEAFLPIALDVVTILRQNLVPLILGAAEALRSVPTPVLAAVTAFGALIAILGPTMIAVGAMLNGFGAVSGAMAKAAQIVKNNLIPALKAMNTTLRANPIGIVVTALAALAAAFVYVYQRSETFRGLFAGVVEGMKSFVTTVQAAVMPTIQGIANMFTGVFTTVSNVVGGFVGTVAERLGGFLPSSVSQGMIKFRDELTSGVQSAVDTAKQIISELRAPSLDLGVTGSNSAAREALYGPLEDASSAVAQGLTVDFDKARDALGDTTIAVKENTLALIPMEEAMQRDIQEMQSHARVIIAAEDHQRELNEQLENGTLRVKDTSAAYDALTAVMGTFSAANETAKQRLGGVANSALDMVSKFTPMGIIVEMLSEALEYLMPVVESLMEPFKIIGLVLGKALASILRALFPVIKMVAIAFTYVGQIFFKISEFLAKAIGYAVYGIGKAIDAIPFVSGKKVIAAGQALIDMGEGFGQAYKDLGAAREEIRGLELPEEKAKESLELVRTSTDANKQTAANTQRIAEAMEEQNKQPRVQVVIQGGSGRGGTDANADIIRQLDDYFGRSTVYEERAVGRVDAFNE